MRESPRLKRGDEVELEISGSAFEGKSIARLNGLVIFVEGGVPGDTLTAKITRVKKNLVEAHLVRVVKPSPLRRDPRCVHAGTCGGCKWQHVDYAGQLQFKQQHVLDAFERIGGFSTVPLQPMIGAEEIFFYRNKMEFSFCDQEWLVTAPRDNASESAPAAGVSATPGVYLGLHVPQRFDKILDLKECHLQSETSTKILSFTRSFCRDRRVPVYSSEMDSGYLRFLVIRQARHTNELMVNLVTRTDDPEFMNEYTKALRTEVPSITTLVNTINSRKAQIAYGDLERVYAGEGTIREKLGRFTFVISAGSFFQTNTAQAERLYEVVREFGEFHKSDTVFDLYSGTGSIALYISGEVGQVVGIESAQSAIADAERNCAANGVNNCHFILGDLKDRLTVDHHWMENYPTPAVIILDPPRSGVHPKVIGKLLEIRPPKIVYVSCNPATQARDLKALSAGPYRIDRMQPVDMFPHTYHIENVALLCRTN
ncbi:MAG TPA: 23S rRNA (uracil(1939)-C(5))-methyltransferase RlmD [Bacteroidota bacterium]|nr:23S rRNA (uracil(1939)-C(5))-methyltransferase RlmD [Bacteroidota bacterium]